MAPFSYFLAPGTHGVMVGDDLVLLNIRADAYLCLAGAPGQTLDVQARVLEAPDRQMGAELEAAGLVVTTKPDTTWGVGKAPPALPTRSASTGPAQRPRWSDAPQAAWSVADAGRRYLAKPLAEIVRSAASGAPRSASDASGDVLDLVERFRRWIPYAPVSGKCLLRSFMLLRLLRRHGHDAQWVFAVRTYPFAAHCWLQSGDMVLDDAHEQLAAFHPIMAV